MTSGRRGLIATLDSVASTKLLSGQVEIKRFPAAPIVLLLASGLIIFAATGLHGYPYEPNSPLNVWFLQGQLLYAWLCVVAYFVWLYLVARPSSHRSALTTRLQLGSVTAWMLLCAILVGLAYFSPPPPSSVPGNPPEGCPFQISHLPCVTEIITNSAFWATVNLALILLVVMSTVLRVTRRVRGLPIETGLFLEKPDVSDVLAGDTLGLAAWCAVLAFIFEPARVVSLVHLTSSPVSGQTPTDYIKGILSMPTGWPSFAANQTLQDFDQNLALYCALIGLSFLAISAVLTLLRYAGIVAKVELPPDGEVSVENASAIGRVAAGISRRVERLTEAESPSPPVLALAFVLKLIGMFLDAIGRFIGLGANNLISVLRNGVWPLLIPAALLLFAVSSDGIHADLHLLSNLHGCQAHLASACNDLQGADSGTARQYYLEGVGAAIAATLLLVFAAALSLAGRTLKQLRAKSGSRRATDLAVLVDLIAAAVRDTWLAAFVVLITMWLLQLTLYLVNLILINRHVTEHTPFTAFGVTFWVSLAALVGFAIIGLVVVLPRRRTATPSNGAVQP